VWQRLLVQTEGSDNHVWTLGFLGRLAARRGDREEAMEYFRQLETLDIAPVFYWSLPYHLAYQRAQIATLLGDRNGAVEILRAASNKELFTDFGKGHMENNNADLAALKGYAPYDELVAPRPIHEIW
jgi:tetratricopeptide (TPR) repeat protein